MSKGPKPLRRKADSNKMKEAIDWLERQDWLESQGYPVSRPTEWQLKIGEINFYPDKGTIIRDGGRHSHPDRGLAALQQLLLRQAHDLADDIEIVIRPAYLE